MEDSSSQDEETTKEKVLSRRMKAFSVLNLFGYGSLWFAGENVALEFKEARPMDSLKYLKTVVAFANGRCLAHGVTAVVTCCASSASPRRV